jgi:uncharacterized protein YqeY
MGLKDQIATDLKDAMRENDAVRRDTLRSLLTAINNTAIARVDVKDESATREELSEEDVAGVLQKQAKQRRESIAEYEKAARTDLVDRETAELAIIAAYLPQQMSRDEITAEVRKAIEEVGATGPGDKSKLMPVLMGRLKGKADGREINEVVTELLK